MPIYADSGRGVHPSVRPSTSRFWPLDELLSTDDGADLMGSGDAFSDLSGNPVPSVVDSLIGGKARSFGGANVILQAPGAASVESDMKADDLTLGIWLRLTSAPTVQDALFAFSGPTGSAALADNGLFRVFLDTDGVPTVSWEAGAATEAHSFSSYEVPLYAWTYLAFRKHVGTVPTHQAVDLFVNGQLVETSADMLPPTDGSNSTWTIGASHLTGTTIVQEIPADVASLQFWNAALTPEEIVDDARRAFLLPLQSRIDARALVEDQSSSMIDVTDLNGLGVDFLDGFSVSNGGDQPVKTATVDLLREQENLSLAYLKTDTRINLTDITDPSAYAPFLDANRAIWLEAARLPLFILAESSDYVRIFQGRIDEVDWGRDKVSLSCRDDGGILVDTFIEEERPYGATTTATLEQVLQTLLDDNDSSAVSDSYAPILLYSPVPSQWILNLVDPPAPSAVSKTLLQRREPVMSALRTLVGQIGWEIRFRYDLNTATWRLTLFEPDRLREDVDFAFAPDDILDITQSKISATQTRNVVRVSYPSSETSGPPAPTNPLPAGITNIGQGWNNVDGESNRTFAYFTVTNAGARAKYGRRFMEVNEASSSQIDTVDEAARMAAAMCLDLAEPELLYDVTMPLFHEIDVQDVATFLTNRIMHTGDQKRLAVHGVRHTFGDSCTTSISTRGKPSVGFNRWLVLDTRPGMGKPPTIDPFNTLTDMTVGQLVPYVTGLLDRTGYFAGGKFLQVRNPDFSSWTRGVDNPPDGWSVAGGAVWGTDIEEESSVVASGGHAVRFLSNTGSLVSDLIPVEGQKDKPLTLDLRYTVPVGSTSTPIIKVKWYNNARQEILSGDGQSAFPGVAANISTLERNANIATVTTAAGHGLNPGDMVSVRPADVTAANQDFAVEKQVITPVLANTFTYPNTGANIGPLVDTGPDGSPGSWVLRPRQTTGPAVPTALEWIMYRKADVETPDPSGSGRFISIEITNGTADELIVDHCTIYTAARETRLTHRSISAIVGGGSLNAWALTDARGDVNLYSDGYDYGRNWFTQPYSGSANPMGPIYFRARENMRLRIDCRFRWNNPGVNAINDARLRIVKNETYTVPGIPTGAGTEILRGQVALPGGADLGVTTDIIEAEVSGVVEVVEGDLLTVEHFITATAVSLNPDTTTANNYVIYKQESVD